MIEDIRHLFKPGYILPFIRSLYIKVRFGRQIEFNITRTFFGARFSLKISGGGKLRIDGSRDRVYFDRDVTVVCSGGTIEIGSGTFFNAFCRLTSHARISIGNDCLFGPNVSVYDSDHRTAAGGVIRDLGYEKMPVAISDNCWIGTNAVILKGSTVETGTVVGANSVVHGTLLANRIYAGMPARLIREIDPPQN